MFVKFVITKTSRSGRLVGLHASYLHNRYSSSEWSEQEASQDWESAGEWKCDSGDPNKPWQYRESPVERAWADQQDRKYLRVLAEKKPEIFLEEMTPNPKHDGCCTGLDLNHPHHKDLAREFRSEVERICKERGLTDHPALFDLAKLAQDGAAPALSQATEGGGASKEDEPEDSFEDAIAKLQQTMVDLREEATRLEAQNAAAEKQVREDRAWAEATLAEREAALNTAKDAQTQLATQNRDLKAQQTQLTERRAAVSDNIAALEAELAALEAEHAQVTQALNEATWARPAWLRVLHGKRTPEDQQPDYQPIANKPGGTASGFVVRSAKDRRFIAKMGVSGDELGADVRAMSITWRRTVLSCVWEKIAADVYALLGRGKIYVPKHRLAKLNILNAFSRQNMLTTALFDVINQGRPRGERITQGVHLLSSFMARYKDIKALEACMVNPGDAPQPFMVCLEAGMVPQYALIDDQVVPIIGLMDIMAAAQLMADTDVLGGSGMNAGFVIERGDDGSPLAVRMVKIDAGNAFVFETDGNFFNEGKLKDPKDMQFANNGSTIKWANLVDQQKQRFLHAFKQGLAILTNQRLVDFIVQRRGLFDRAVSYPLLTEAIVGPFKARWATYIERLTKPEVYAEALGDLPDLPAAEAIPYRPKAYGAVNYSLEEAEWLAEEDDQAAGPGLGGGGAGR